jgi:hypothetical protein
MSELTFSDQMLRYNAPSDSRKRNKTREGDSLDHAISKASKSLKYCPRTKCVYEVAYDVDKNKKVIFEYPEFPAHFAYETESTSTEELKDLEHCICL